MKYSTTQGMKSLAATCHEKVSENINLIKLYEFISSLTFSFSLLVEPGPHWGMEGVSLDKKEQEFYQRGCWTRLCKFNFIINSNNYIFLLSYNIF